MAGLRYYTTTEPAVWRFPRWKDNTYYPAGSFVAVTTYNPADSEDVTFSYYVSIQNVAYDNKTDGTGTVITNGGSWAPNDSDSDWVNHSIYSYNPWALAFDTTQDVFDATLITTINSLLPLLPLIGIDSDVAILFRNDSDFRVKDSEQDSDILQAYHDAWAWDSDRDSEAQRRLDSEIHDRKAADSDLQIQIFDNDSDILMEIHDRKAADSDLQVQIFDNDSDILMEIHDRKAGDSDIIAMFDSEIRRLDRIADSDSDRLTNFIHRYEQRDSDIALKFDQHDSDIEYLRNNMATGGSSTGFPVGAIVPFATKVMPPGFGLCDGSTYNTGLYPELAAVLGSNTLPDLRGAFIRGWVDDKHEPLTTQQLKGLTDDYIWDGTTHYATSSVYVSNTVATVTWAGRGGITGDSEDVVFTASSQTSYSSTSSIARLFYSSGANWISNGGDDNVITMLSTGADAYPAYFTLNTSRSNNEHYRTARVVWTYANGHVEYTLDSPGSTESNNLVQRQFLNKYLESPVSKIEIILGGGWGAYPGARFFTMGFFKANTVTGTTGSGAVSLGFGIAMYNGAGIATDSDILAGAVADKLAVFDSDINALYNRTNYHSETYAPTVNVATGSTYTIGVDTSFFDDIEVQLNGVSVSQWVAAGTNFTLNFALRGNVDVVTFKLRR